MGDGTGLAEAILGLDGFRVLAVDESSSEVVITIETVASVVGCRSCGVLAEIHDRLRVDVRDLPCFGRPARLVWLKRRWRCREEECPAKTWTEQMPGAVPARAVLTVRAGADATRQVGELAQPVASVARELGVCWWTVMDAVWRHGTPLVDDPERVGTVRALYERVVETQATERLAVYGLGSLVDDSCSWPFSSSRSAPDTTIGALDPRRRGDFRACGTARGNARQLRSACSKRLLRLNPRSQRRVGLPCPRRTSYVGVARPGGKGWRSAGQLWPRLGSRARGSTT
jgi:hypothetical protein